MAGNEATLTPVERLGLRTVEAFEAYVAAPQDAALGRAADAALAELDAALRAAAHGEARPAADARADTCAPPAHLFGDGEDSALDPVSFPDDGISR